MSGIIAAFERGVLRGLIIMATSVGVAWLLEKLWGRP